MSNINTNGINGNFPTSGVNNDTQGFRDNFTSIKTNLGTAKTEISDLQNKVILKSALDNTTLNNDMGGLVISNVKTQGFRASVNQIYAGASIPSTITIDVSKGDIQYGNIVENTTLAFTGWSPSGTQSQVVLSLNIANANAMIHLPLTSFDGSGGLTQGMRQSAGRVENMMTYYTSNSAYVAGYQSAVGANVIPTFTIPNGVTELQFRLTSVDCGSTFDIEPITRNQTASQIEIRTPTDVGLAGDFPGRICTNGANLYVCIGVYDSSTPIWTYIPLTPV